MSFNKLKEAFLDKGVFKLKSGELVEDDQGRQKGGKSASGHGDSI